MSRPRPALATVFRAYAAGRVDSLRQPSPLQAHRVAAALAAAPEEVRAAYALGKAADPAGPMPESGAVLAAVVARLAGSPQVPPGDTTGPECAALGQLGQVGVGGTRRCRSQSPPSPSPPTT